MYFRQVFVTFYLYLNYSNLENQITIFFINQVKVIFKRILARSFISHSKRLKYGLIKFVRYVENYDIIIFSSIR